MNINMTMKKIKIILPQMIIMQAAYTNRMSFLGNKKVKFWDGETVPENKLPSILEVEQLEGLIGPHGAVFLEVQFQKIGNFGRASARRTRGKVFIFQKSQGP